MCVRERERERERERKHLLGFAERCLVAVFEDDLCFMDIVQG